MARYSEIKTGLWKVIPEPEKNKKLFHKNLAYRPDPIEYMESEKIKYCRYSQRPITDNRKEIHPRTMAEEGFCPYCGKLK